MAKGTYDYSATSPLSPCLDHRIPPRKTQTTICRKEKVEDLQQYATFAEYFKRKYDINLMHENAPMIQVSSRRPAPPVFPSCVRFGPVAVYGLASFIVLLIRSSSAPRAQSRSCASSSTRGDELYISRACGTIRATGVAAPLVTMHRYRPIGSRRRRARESTTFSLLSATAREHPLHSTSRSFKTTSVALATQPKEQLQMSQKRKGPTYTRMHLTNTTTSQRRRKRTGAPRPTERVGTEHTR